MDTQLSLQVLTLLRDIFKCTVDTQRQAVEAQLNTLATDWLNFLQTLLGVVLSREQDVTADLRASAAGIILAKVRQLEDMQTATASLIFSALLQAQGREADLLAEAMEILLQAQDEEMTLAKDFFTQLERIYQVQPAISFKLLRALFSAVGTAMMTYTPRAVHILQVTGEAYLSSGGSLQILVEWSKALEQVVNYGLTDSDTATMLVNDAGLVGLLEKLMVFQRREGDILLICSPTDVFSYDFVLFLLKTISALLQNVLDRKQEELERLHSTKFTTVSGFAAPEIPTTQLISHMLEPLLHNLQSFCSLPNYSALLYTEEISDIVVEAVGILTKACSDTLFYPFFAKAYPSLTVFLIPLLLSPLSKETEDFADNPEEFVALALDICEERESMTAKTAAARLLDVLVNQVDGCLSFVGNFYAQVVDYTVHSSENLIGYPLLGKHREAEIGVLRQPEQERMDISLLALCIISPSLIERKDLKMLVSSLLSLHFPALALSPSQLLRSRLALVCMRFASVFDPESIQNVARMLEFLVFCLRPEETSKPVAIQAAEALSEIVRNPIIVTSLEAALPQIMGLLLSVAKNQTEKSFFEALEELIKSNSRLFVPILPQILSALISKILADYHKDPQNLSNSSISQQKCWNILQEICDCPDFNPSQLAVLEEGLWPVFQLLGTKKLSFEDEICTTLGCLIKRSKTVTGMGWKMFEAFRVVQGFAEGSLRSLFYALNYFVLYSLEGLQKEPSRASLMFTMLVDGLGLSTADKSSEEEGSKAALLLQVLLTTYQGAFYEQYTVLFQRIFDRYSHSTKKYFKVKLAEIAICAFAANPVYTLTVLSQMPSLGTTPGPQAAVMLILEALPSFRFAYDRKVAVMGLGAWLGCEQIPGELIAGLPSYFQQVARLLIEAANEKPKKKSKGRSKDASSLVVKGTSVHIKLSSSETTEEKRLQTTLKSLSSPIKDLNEVIFLRQTLDKLRISNPVLFNALVSSLTPDQKTGLVAALQGCKVEGSDNIRKIVKVKRTQGTTS